MIRERQARADVVVHKTTRGFVITVNPACFPQFTCRRMETFAKVTNEIVRHQSAYFHKGPAHLLPLTMQTVADALGLNVCSVSRAIEGRSMQTPQGRVSLKFFFARGIQKTAGKPVCTANIRDLIGQLIAAEDPHQPLSDPKLDAELRRRGYRIARRTVTKYREALGLPDYRLRRKAG